MEDKDFIVFYDSSYSSLGAVLIYDKNDIAYASRQLKVLDKNYPNSWFRAGSGGFYTQNMEALLLYC